jgi:outer membrane lipoprotein carrier protein
VQSFYERTSTISARFNQTYFHKLYNRTDRSRGAVVFKKPGKMRWDYDRPNGKVIVSDGAELTVFEPGEAGQSGQVYEQPLDDSQLPQAFSFLTGGGRLEQDFTFRLLDSARQGFVEGYVLELRPRAPSPHYERILFYVAKRDGQPVGVVRRVLIVDATGNRNRFDFEELDFNSAIPDARFQFRVPAGTRSIHP